MQLDQNPTTKNWLASLLQAQTRVRATDWLTIRGRFTTRQPYRIYSLISPISTRREHIQGGLLLNLTGAQIGGDYSVRFTEGTYESRTYVAYFNTPMLTTAQFSLFGSGSYWEANLGSALFVNGGISKSLGTYLIRIDYGFYRSTNKNQIDPIDVHRYTLSATLPFSKKFYMNVRGNLQQSQFLNSYSVNTSIQYRF